MSREARPCGGDSRPSLSSGLARHACPVSGPGSLPRAPEPPSPRVPRQWCWRQQNPPWPLLQKDGLWVPGDLARLVSRGWGTRVRTGQEAREERAHARPSPPGTRHQLVPSAPRLSSRLTSGTGTDRRARRPHPPPQSRVRGCPRPPGCVGKGLGQKDSAEPLSVEGSSRIKGEVTDTVTRILGSSQDKMTMLASGSEDTSYLSSVTIYEVQIQHKAVSYS